MQLLRALGVRVIEVEDLDGDAHYVPEPQLLLVDAALTPRQRASITDQLLPRLWQSNEPTHAQ